MNNDIKEIYLGELILMQDLNDEVEILEEEKKAPTLNNIRESYGLPRIEETKIPEELKLYAPYPECDGTRFDDVEEKINEIIEYLESKEK